MDKFDNFIQDVQKLAKAQGIRCAVILVPEDEPENINSLSNEPYSASFADLFEMIDQQIYENESESRVSITICLAHGSIYPSYLLRTVKPNKHIMWRDCAYKVLDIFGVNAQGNEKLILRIIVDTDETRKPLWFKVMQFKDINLGSADYMMVDGLEHIFPSTKLNHPQIWDQADDCLRDIISYVNNKFN